MTITVSPNQSDIQTALRTFLLGILTNTEVVIGQVNRVPEPESQDFIVMWAINRNRIETNIDDGIDVSFVASIAGTVMTVSAINYGTIEVGNIIFGVGVTNGTIIQSEGSGTGGVGTYNINNSQTVASEKMAAGFTELIQPTEVIMQLDVHGPSSADNVQIISTMFRDPYATETFASLNADVTPLYTDDPRQAPFINAEQQYETRWTVDVHLQANQSITVSQDFAETVDVDVINVEATYP